MAERVTLVFMAFNYFTVVSLK